MVLSFKDLEAIERKAREKFEARQRKYGRKKMSTSKTPMRKPTAPQNFMDVEGLAKMDALSQALSVKAEPEDSYLTPIKENNKRRKVYGPSFESPGILASPPSSSWQNRKDPGKTVVTYNSSLVPATNGVKQTVSVSIDLLESWKLSSKNEKFRYMFMEMEEVSENLNAMTAFLMRKLEEQIPLLPEYKDLEDFEFSPVNFPAQKTSFICGRIINEATEGSLNSKSLILEGDRVISAGNHIKLDVSQLQSYALFPGQVVAFEGINPSGHCFIAKRVFVPSFSPSPKYPLQKFLQEKKSLQTRPTSVMVAVGPFTTSDNLRYWPLTALMDAVEQRRPDVLIMAGPFVPSLHRKVFLGEMRQTYEDQYKAVINTVAHKLRGSTTHALIIPSPNDAHEHVVYPQPPNPTLEAHNIDFLPNPAMFKVNDITIGISNVDVIKHMSKQEISRRGPGEKSNRLTRLASHLISQRNFYPLYPAEKKTPLDHTHAMRMRMNVQPDLLITPGDLNYFANKSTDGNTVCVNPGKLAKGPSGGTYAMVTLHDLKEQVEGDEFDRKTQDRIRVDVVKI